MNDLTELATHFGFGKNWSDFVERVDEDAIKEAEHGLVKLIDPEDLEGSSFLDIGCGSGLHSLAALNLKVARLMAVDIDPISVETARRLLSGREADVAQRSVFDTDPAELGLFDIVYSWGVLHHTGAMWKAIEQASALVSPGGLFAIAIYQKTPLCNAWKVEKRIYSKAHPLLQRGIRSLYIPALFAGLIARGRNPYRYIKGYKSARGMNFFTDVHDWLGGYPYESATPREITTFLEQRGFTLERCFPRPSGVGVAGAGCAEFTFRRIADPVN